MKNKTGFWILGLALAGGVGVWRLATRVSIPRGAKAVKPFWKDKYLGKWYEIARMDFKYEKGLDYVTAEYSLRKDGLIRVDNRGYRPGKNKWEESIGKAKFAGPADEGRLKVSFFGPFYAGYNVIAIDPLYRYALVAGNNLSYLWLLSRERTMPGDVKNNYVNKASALGYDIEKLVWTKQG